MKNAYGLLKKLISDLETRPKMLLVNPDFISLKCFLLGYVTAIEDVYSFHFNKLFSEWLNSRGPKTSLFWTEYIYIIAAEKNDEVAYNLLITKFKDFVEEYKLELSDNI